MPPPLHVRRTYAITTFHVMCYAFYYVPHVAKSRRPALVRDRPSVVNSATTGIKLTLIAHSCQLLAINSQGDGFLPITFMDSPHRSPIQPPHTPPRPFH